MGTTYTNDPTKRGRPGYTFIGPDYAKRSSSQSMTAVAPPEVAGYDKDVMGAAVSRYPQPSPTTAPAPAPAPAPIPVHVTGPATAPAPSTYTRAGSSSSSYDTSFAGAPLWGSDTKRTSTAQRGSITFHGQPLGQGGIGPAPSTPPPKLGPAPALNLPEYDRSRVRSLTQELAGPGTASLRREVQRAASRGYDNPMVRAYAMRQALEGYGMGLGKVLQSAGVAAASQYGQELAQETAEVQANYQADIRKWEMDWQNTWSSYMRGIKSTPSPYVAAEDRKDQSA